jgi:ribonuclease VapC
VILDSSAVVAVLQEEEGYEELKQKMREADVLAIGAPTWVESGLVMIRANGEPGWLAIWRLREELGLVVLPFDEVHSDVAIEAFFRFGKGRHPAALNYGDCMTYATAQLARHPLLFKGNDFAQTDVRAA